MMPTASFPFHSPPHPTLCSSWKGGWIVQTCGCSSLKVRYIGMGGGGCWCIDGVTSLLLSIVVNNLNIGDWINIWGFCGLNYGNCPT